MLGSCARWVVVLVAAGTPALSLAGCRACCEPVRCQPVCAPQQAVAVPAPGAAVPAGRPILVSIDVFRLAVGFSVAATGSAQVGGRTYPVLSKADADRLLARLELARRSTGPGGAGVAYVAMPRILALSGEVGTISVVETIGPDVPGRTGREPLSFAGGDDWVGMRTAIRATASEDGTHVSMDFSFAHREAPREGQVPDPSALRASEVSMRVEGLSVASGDTVLLFTGPSLDAEVPQLWVLLRPLVVRPEDLGTAVPSESAPYAPAPARPPTPPSPGYAETLTAVRLTLSMKDAPLLSVLKAIAEKGKLSLFVSPDVADVPVSIDVKDEDVATVLTALGQGRFLWTVEDYGIIRIQGLPPK